MTQIKKGVHTGRTKPVERKYYGCIHCHSLAVKRLSSCIGDPEGFREDKECLVCGGVYGTCKSSNTTITEPEWRDEKDEPYPHPDRQRVAAMKMLIMLEEQFGFRFRSREVEAAKALAALIEAHAEGLIKSTTALKDRMESVQRAIAGHAVAGGK